jgi:hypothetical protein
MKSVRNETKTPTRSDPVRGETRSSDAATTRDTQPPPVSIASGPTGTTVNGEPVTDEQAKPCAKLLPPGGDDDAEKAMPPPKPRPTAICAPLNWPPKSQAAADEAAEKAKTA